MRKSNPTVHPLQVPQTPNTITVRVGWVHRGSWQLGYRYCSKSRHLYNCWNLKHQPPVETEIFTELGNHQIFRFYVSIRGLTTSPTWSTLDKQKTSWKQVPILVATKVLHENARWNKKKLRVLIWQLVNFKISMNMSFIFKQEIPVPLDLFWAPSRWTRNKGQNWWKRRWVQNPSKKRPYFRDGDLHFGEGYPLNSPWILGLPHGFSSLFLCNTIIFCAVTLNQLPKNHYWDRCLVCWRIGDESPGGMKSRW